MRPSRLQLNLLGCWIALAVALALLRSNLGEELAQLASTGWWLAGLLLGLLLIVDGGRRYECRNITATRHMPGSFSLGAVNIVTIKITNPFRRSLQLEVYDQFPQQVSSDTFPYKITIPASETAEINYQAKPTKRGDAEFQKIELRVRSGLRLWDYHIQRGEPATVKIYPNFANITSLSALGHEQHISQVGIHNHQRRGQGLEFHQLRKYREGDTLAQIDWKASARHAKLISREYQDERDQDIIFLLDCGRRMRTLDGEYSHFDHALNVVLLTAYVALKQGDSVGILSFAGESRWIPPIKGPTAINKLLNQVYDLHSTTQTSDLLEAAEHLMARHRKRALVILISNIREEDRDDVLSATRVLSKQHLVMVASLKEELLESTTNDPVTNFDTALRYSGAQQFIEQRRKVLETLVLGGVVITDSLAKTLHIDLANQYLNLKRSGRI